MSCRFCGTALPGEALYCPECGRPAARKRPEMPAVGPAPVAPLAAPAGGSSPRSAGGDVPICPQCGRRVADSDFFCGACGFVLGTAVGGDARQTAVVDVDPAELDAEPVAEAEPEPEPEPVAEEEPEPEPAPTPAPRAKPRDVPDPFPWGTPRTGPVDLEKTRAVASPPAEERFVLQFSTGESVTVTGAGLIGRNPSSQPGEYVDQLVTIFDAGKSVSKTHLAFGQESGRFWVSDRYSTNGSTVRQPDLEPKRCEPGRRYFVARGTRVDIGEQFFVVS